MSTYQWFVFFLIVQVIHGLGTWKLYEKAGRKRWEAFVPVYNAIVLMRIIGRPTLWTLLLFIPIINLIMFPVIWVETLRSFGKKSTADTWLGIFTFGLYIYYINYTQDVNYISDRSLVSTTKTGDTISSLLFAIVVATLVHTYVMQPFTIPSSSLEKSLLVGDFLFVSKFHYGARIPMTTVAAPMVHDTLPFVKIKSYLYDDDNPQSWKNKLQLPYFRFPGFEKIENSDIVVFNWPRDTLFHMYKPADRRYSKPTDKKTNYVKRCVGIPGDSLQIKNGIVFINGKELILPERAKPQFGFNVKLKENLSQGFIDQYDIKEFNTGIKVERKLWDNTVVKDYLDKEGYNLNELYKDSTEVYVLGSIDEDLIKKLNLRSSLNFFQANLTQEIADQLKKDSRVESINRYLKTGAEDGIFPDFPDRKPSVTNNWNSDNMGPIYIPEAGKTVNLNLQTLPFYKIIIGEYEKNDLKVIGDDIYINDQKVTSYTFKQNYYWMMGDNRNNSLDARYYGYTPEDHIVGKPVFIWMSWDSNGSGLNKIRWNRLFTTVNGEGQPESYFKYFLGLVALYVLGDYFWKRRKAKA
ncbi:signal peptidase I [Flavobacterium sp. J49]|uniref:signal peptidase I n=1 Tax=Flavobacterium sp. J49 TaxID=2718534 RepID=UPI001594685E|nr:signal peptidase I [Flavobacterium sp. J49]MBF6642451.1 signal peptidase I [Flavobacterium sp. J49]NIC03697.1 signal peptidase I [Flavobacterium sp. J49]